MMMEKYKIEFTLKSNDLFKSLVVVADPASDVDFIMICDSIFIDNHDGKRELSVYFFRSSDDARKYTYRRIVLDESESEAIIDSDCTGYMTKNTFHIIKEKSEFMKILFSLTEIKNYSIVTEH